MKKPMKGNSTPSHLYIVVTNIASPLIGRNVCCMTCIERPPVFLFPFIRWPLIIYMYRFNCISFQTLFLQINCVAFSRDLEMMVTGSDDGRVRVWNRPKNILVCRFFGHTGKTEGYVKGSKGYIL